MMGARLFRSRWAALLWAGGIVWTAYDVADAFKDESGNTAVAANEAAPIDATGMVADARDLAILAAAGNTD